MIAKKLSIEFNYIKDEIREVYISVGMITKSKYEFFLRAAAHTERISIVTGIHMRTPPEVLRSLKEKTEQNRLQARVYLDKYFHPKLYVFRLADRWVAYVGSGNFTDGGWHENEELFFIVHDQASCDELRNQHNIWFEASQPITDRILDYYTQTFIANKEKERETRKNTQLLLDQLKNVFNIDAISFAGQYFSKQDHLTFAPGKTHLDTSEILAERNIVRNKLYHLDDELQKVIPPVWDLHHHYKTANIVANIETAHHHEDNVRGLLVAYGRSDKDLKKYGEVETTPLNFMRMQVIVKYDTVGLWLMPGKNGANQIDREFFKESMQRPDYRKKFFDLLTRLRDPYWIEVAGIARDVTSFENPDSLKEFTDTDNWRYHYFIIGRDYDLGVPELKQANFITTVLSDFGKSLPIYNLMKHSLNGSGLHQLSTGNHHQKERKIRSHKRGRNDRTLKRECAGE
jgi:HKD family nuclease